MTGAADLAAFLAGAWSVQRDVNHGAGHFTGQARFEDDGAGGLHWRERGRFTFQRQDGEAHRDLRIVPAAGDGPSGGWEVRFDDGRPFHPLDLARGHATPVHLCGADTYRGEFTLVGPDELRTVWRVTGPRHDDVIATTYRRLTAPPRSAAPPG